MTGKQPNQSELALAAKTAQYNFDLCIDTVGPSLLLKPAICTSYHYVLRAIIEWKKKMPRAANVL